MKGGKVVTIDISTESDAVLPSCPESSRIQKIVGDANSLEVIEQVGMVLNRTGILYVDADHRALPTLLNFSIYSTLLRPKVVGMSLPTIGAVCLRLRRRFEPLSKAPGQT